jgi:hypothetical protein
VAVKSNTLYYEKNTFNPFKVLYVRKLLPKLIHKIDPQEEKCEIQYMTKYEEKCTSVNENVSGFLT